MRLLRQRGSAQALARRGGVNGAQAGPAEGQLGDVGHREGHALQQFTVGRIAPHFMPGEQAGPDRAGTVHHRAVGVALAGCDDGQHARAVHAAVGLQRAGPDGAAQGVGVVQRAAVGRHRRAVGDGHRRQAAVGQHAVLQAVQAARLGDFGVVHAAEPQPALGVGAGVVQAVAGVLRFGQQGQRELAGCGVETVYARLQAHGPTAVVQRQQPTGLGRRRPAPQFTAGRRVAQQFGCLDVDEPQRLAGHVPDRPFAQHGAHFADRLRYAAHRDFNANPRQQSSCSRCTCARCRTPGTASAAPRRRAARAASGTGRPGCAGFRLRHATARPAAPF